MVVLSTSEKHKDQNFKQEYVSSYITIAEKTLRDIYGCFVYVGEA
jgi:hypothetical protein